MQIHCPVSVNSTQTYQVNFFPSKTHFHMLALVTYVQYIQVIVSWLYSLTHAVVLNPNSGFSLLGHFIGLFLICLLMCWVGLKDAGLYFSTQMLGSVCSSFLRGNSWMKLRFELHFFPIKLLLSKEENYCSLTFSLFCLHESHS